MTDYWCPSASAHNGGPCLVCDRSLTIPAPPSIWEAARTTGAVDRSDTLIAATGWCAPSTTEWEVTS